MEGRVLVEESVMEVLDESGPNLTSRGQTESKSAPKLKNKSAPGISTSAVRVENPLEEGKKKKKTSPTAKTGYNEMMQFWTHRPHHPIRLQFGFRRFNNEKKDDEQKTGPS